jgi:hypothetical protein
MDAYNRLLDALDTIELKIEKSGETRICDLDDLFTRLGELCARAKGAALLLTEKCK